MTKLTLPIVPCKKYIARNGLVVSTLGYTLANPDVIGTSHRAVWAKSGEVVGSVPGDAFDLVADYIEPTGHVHAVLMAQYAQDAATNPEPWTLWEVRSPNALWNDLPTHPSWVGLSEYRRKPRTITINGIEVPEPLRVAPEDGALVYLVGIGVESLYSPYQYDANHPCPPQFLAQGILHATKDAARAHAEALLSFTSVTP